MKKLFTGVLALALLLSMSACGGTDKPEAIPSATPRRETEESVAPSSPSGQEDLAAETTELDERVMADVKGMISDLRVEYEALKGEVQTYDAYLANTEKMEGFYTKARENTKSLCVKLRQHSAAYADSVLSSDRSCNEKAEELGELFDCVYDRAGKEIFDEIYDGVLKDAFDDFYDGILKDAYDQAEYREWADARSDEYDWWGDTRSDVYDEWSDFRSDIYDLWSDLRSELWSDDEERAREKLDDFQNNLEKLMSGLPEEVLTASEEISAVPASEKPEESQPSEKASEKPEEAEPSQEPAESDAPSGPEAGIRPEFQEAMDSYEAFYDQYCDILETYSENPTDLDILGEYSDMLLKSAEMSKAFEKWEDEELSEAELAYYLEVNNRVAQKLLAVAS